MTKKAKITQKMFEMVLKIENNEDKIAIYDAICNYQFYGVIPKFENTYMNLVFDLIITDLKKKKNKKNKIKNNNNHNDNDENNEKIELECGIINVNRELASFYGSLSYRLKEKINQCKTTQQALAIITERFESKKQNELKLIEMAEKLAKK